MATPDPVGVPGADPSTISDQNPEKVLENDEQRSETNVEHPGFSDGNIPSAEVDEEPPTEGAKDRVVFADQLASDYSKYMQPNVDSEVRFKRGFYCSIES